MCKSGNGGKGWPEAPDRAAPLLEVIPNMAVAWMDISSDLWEKVPGSYQCLILAVQLTQAGLGDSAGGEKGLRALFTLAVVQAQQQQTVTLPPA